MALAYLLSPTFEFVNTAGKPLTGGYLEVYIAGSREKYYCASDFSGTLHPFRIPLDSLGANVVLAEEGNSYDVYVYNRYGGLVMSRYNVKPGEGGGISGDSITSTDGSIIVTQTGDGVDLRVNAKPPTVMRCTASDLTGDGAFQFSELQRDGTSARVDSYTVKIDEGWWHYDATVRLRWTGEANATQSISLYSINSSDSLTFDLSYPHAETVRVSGEHKATQNGTAFVLGILGVPVGMTVSMVDFGIHSIVGEGAGGKYNGGTGIVIDETNRVISIDPEVVQEKLTAGSNITIDSNNVISAVVPEYANADWDATSGEPGYIYHKPDLSVYATTQEVETALEDKQDVLTAGSNIQLNGSTISATDTTYTAGNGLELSGTEFSVDTTEIQEKLTAGTGIIIGDDGVISVDESAINEIFPVTYNVTTFNEIRSALIAGKLPVLYKGDPEDIAVRVQRIPIYELFDGGTYKYAQFWTPYVYSSPSTEYPPYANFEVFSASYDTGTGNTTWSTSRKYFAEQSDWAEADAKKLTFIKNKPDLSVYATQTDLTNGLATKQDTISDLSDIRAGAQAGSTAVQPATLNDYVTNSALATTLADYVTDTELGTILEGYQTALTAGSNIQISNGTISATDTTYTAGTALSLTGTEFSVKVDGTTVTVNSSGELQAAPAITVDQTYDATSTNPQSGTAVAQAVAGVDTGLFEAVYGTTTLGAIQGAISAHKIVYCRASGRMAFLAYIGSNQVEFQYYRSNDGGTGDSVFVYTVNSSGWTTTERPAYVQADWSTTSSSAASYIKHKPDLSVYATTASLGAVAFSNDYDDLDNKPTIPELPATKDLVAGNNITLTEGNDDVTVACSITIGTVEV